MLIFKTVLIQSFSNFWACLFSQHAYFRKGAYYRASAVVNFTYATSSYFTHRVKVTILHK